MDKSCFSIQSLCEVSDSSSIDGGVEFSFIDVSHMGDFSCLLIQGEGFFNSLIVNGEGVSEVTGSLLVEGASF